MFPRMAIPRMAIPCMAIPRMAIPRMAISRVFHVWHTINYTRHVCSTLREIWSTQTHNGIYYIFIVLPRVYK